jgi:hypothetical protein
VDGRLLRAGCVYYKRVPGCKFLSVGRNLVYFVWRNCKATSDWTNCPGPGLHLSLNGRHDTVFGHVTCRVKVNFRDVTIVHHQHLHINGNKQTYKLRVLET